MLNTRNGTGITHYARK
uniref:Uncharacterized protein n=1 Tax=Anguilla anguilla TaxID=7936 RepID=A0A0E9VZ56_ANGAN